jgi:hypothetical protein
VKKIPRYAFTNYSESVCLFVEKTTTSSSQFELEVFSTHYSEEGIMNLRAVQENSIDEFWQDWTPLLKDYAVPFCPGEIGIYQGKDKKRIDALIRHIKREKELRFLDGDHRMKQWELMPMAKYRPTLCGAHLAFGSYDRPEFYVYEYDPYDYEYEYELIEFADTIKKFLKQLEDAWLWVDYDFLPNGPLSDRVRDEEELKEKLAYALKSFRQVSKLLSFAEKCRKFETLSIEKNPFTVNAALLQRAVGKLVDAAYDAFAEVFPT